MRNKKEIEILFGKCKSFSDGITMLRFVDSDSTKFLFAVSSKKFKRAVDRNRIKRLMKESLKDNSIINKNVAIVYVGDGVPTYDTINRSIKQLLGKL